MKKIKAAAALENGSTGHGSATVSYFPQPHYPSGSQIASPNRNYSSSETGAAGRDRAGYAPVSRDQNGRRVPARGGSYPTAPHHTAGHARHDQFYR